MRLEAMNETFTERYSQTNIGHRWDNWKLFDNLYYEENFTEAFIKLFLYVSVGANRFK